MEDVAVLDDVVLGFLAHEMLGLHLALAAQADQVVALHDFRADEAAGQVRVDVLGGLERRPADAEEPR